MTPLQVDNQSYRANPSLWQPQCYTITRNTRKKGEAGAVSDFFLSQVLYTEATHKHGRTSLGL